MKRFKIIHIASLALLFAACSSSPDTRGYAGKTYTIDSLEVDSTIEKLIYPYRGKKERVMSEVVMVLGSDLEKNRDNGSLGYWMCDALLLAARIKHQVKADIAILNHGGVRRPYVKKGQVSRGTVYELMPFENRVFVLKAEASQVYELANEILRRGGAPFSGMMITRRGESVKVEINGQPVKPEETYVILCSDYQYNGGDQYGFLQKMEKVGELGLVRDLLFEGFGLMWSESDHSPYLYPAERRVVDGQ